MRFDELMSVGALPVIHLVFFRRVRKAAERQTNDEPASRRTERTCSVLAQECAPNRRSIAQCDERRDDAASSAIWTRRANGLFGCFAK